MITELNKNCQTDRNWNGRDDISQHYVGRIPLKQPIVTLTLTWKRDEHSKSHMVGKFRFDMKALLKSGYIYQVEGYYILRFQRTRGSIEITRNRNSDAKFIKNLPASYAGAK